MVLTVECTPEMWQPNQSNLQEATLVQPTFVAATPEQDMALPVVS